MKYVPVLFASLVLALSAFLAQADPKQEVTAATQAWADSFNGHDVERIVGLYDPEAVLWGTVSPTLRDTQASIHDYFNSTLTMSHPPRRRRA
jgi:hypothetical protein